MRPADTIFIFKRISIKIHIYFSKINNNFFLYIQILIFKSVLVKETASNWFSRELFCDKLCSCEFCSTHCFILNKNEPESFHTRLQIFKVNNLMWPGDDYIQNSAKPLSHLCDILFDFFIFLIDGQFLNGDKMFEDNYSTGWANNPILDGRQL